MICVGDRITRPLPVSLRRSFGGWAGSSMPPEARRGASAWPAARDPPPSPARARRRRLARARRSPSCGSATSASSGTPDYHALLVLNVVLGGQFVSRVNMNLREDKGYTYGVRSSFDFRRRPRAVRDPGRRGDQRDRGRGARGARELAAIRGARPATARELDCRAASLTRGYPRNFETAEQMARAVAQMALYAPAGRLTSSSSCRRLAASMRRTSARCGGAPLALRGGRGDRRR